MEAKSNGTPPVDEINTARRDYAQHTARTTDLDMRLIANEAERVRLEGEHEAAREAASIARARVFELENNRSKPAPVEARVMSAFALFPVQPGSTAIAGDNVLKDAPETP